MKFRSKDQSSVLVGCHVQNRAVGTGDIVRDEELRDTLQIAMGPTENNEANVRRKARIGCRQQRQASGKTKPSTPTFCPIFAENALAESNQQVNGRLSVHLVIGERRS